MIFLNLDNLSCVKKFLVDGGYSGERFANQVKDICGAQVEVVKRSELHKFVVLPRRWVVERLFGWLDKFRRLSKNCERKLYPDDDDTQPPRVTWRSCANLLYSNWLNYFVYQTTPFDIAAIQDHGNP